MVRGPVHDGGAHPRPAAAHGARGAGEQVESTLGRGTRVRGRVHGDGDLRVEGHVEGDVTVSGTLVLSEGGAIHGDVGAGAIEIGGTLQGDVASQGAVAIRATARVEGNLAGAEVTLDEGATFHGRIEAEFEMPAGLSVTAGGTPAPPGGAPSDANRAGSRVR